jgi:hypothetical protein
MWVEVSFNITYLIVVWALVILMSRRLNHVSAENYTVANLFRWAFVLLAAGDTGHVGFRVLGYALGGLALNPVLVGLGALATSITVTLFYVVMLYIWSKRFNRAFGWFEYFLLALVLVRFIVMALPGNDWGALVAPVFMGNLRNALLILFGFGIIFLYMRDSLRQKDRLFRWIAYMVFLSYLFFTPVVFFSREIPLLGMLMLPKTVMYVIIAIMAYYGLWQTNKPVLAQ